MALNLRDSKLLLEGSPDEREDKRQEILSLKQDLSSDRKKRQQLYRKRWDFYMGYQEEYTTIYGKNTARKKGRPTAVFNYAGRTVKKIATAMANNPPAISIPARHNLPEDEIGPERIRAQSVENFVYDVLDRNMFFLKGYRRGVFNQTLMGDAAIKVYPINRGTKDEEDWDIQIVNHERMDNIRGGVGGGMTLRSMMR